MAYPRPSCRETARREPSARETRRRVVRRLRMLALGAATSYLAAGGSPGSSPAPGGSTAVSSPPAAAQVSLVGFRGGGVTFRYPAAWSHHRPGVLSIRRKCRESSRTTRLPGVREQRRRALWFRSRRRGRSLRKGVGRRSLIRPTRCCGGLRRLRR